MNPNHRGHHQGVVTGAAKGLGRAIARKLASRCQTLVLVDLDTGGLRRLQEDLGAGDGPLERTIVETCDVSDYRSVQNLYGSLQEQGVSADALVNNAAIFPRSDAISMNQDEWVRVIDTNLSGCFWMAQGFARQSPDGGSIVQIASGQAFNPTQRGAHYAAAKAGVVNLTRALAHEWAPLGIRVNTVVPGLADTDQPRAAMTQEEMEVAARSVPLARLITGEDVAHAVDFLLSPASEAITGHSLAVNGGAIML